MITENLRKLLSLDTSTPAVLTVNEFRYNIKIVSFVKKIGGYITTSYRFGPRNIFVSSQVMGYFYELF